MQLWRLLPAARDACGLISGSPATPAPRRPARPAPCAPAGPGAHPDRHFVSLKSPEILPTKQRLPFATPALRNLSAMSPIRKAIFPVAGLGTRFLPATKAMPKEMLTVVDRPIIQHVVDEAREAGIEHFIFVTGRNKGVIEDHFDRQLELEFTLNERGKHAELELLNRELPGAGTTSFTRQQTPLGLGHAAWCARELVGREPFALLLPDVLVQAPHRR